MFKHLWIASKKTLKHKRKKLEHFEKFYEDVLEECLKYGDVESMNVIQNM